MKEQKVITFKFQQIPLAEAKHLAAAGSGKYSDVRAVLLSTLPNLPPDQAFAFKADEGQTLDQETRKGLLVSLNNTLAKADVPWKVTYSSLRKAFVCVPRALGQRKALAPKRPKEIHGPGPMSLDRLMEIAEQVLGSPGEWTKILSQTFRRRRAAICQVGIDDFHISPKLLGPRLGLTPGAVLFNAHYGEQENYAEYVQMLRQAINQNGGIQ